MTDLKAIASSVAILLAITGSAHAEAGSLGAAILGGKPILDIRPRYEGVDQAGFSNDAAAYTLRTQFGWQTGTWLGLQALVEAQDVTHVGPQDYNTTLNHRMAYPVVADPDGVELHRLQLSWTPNPAFTGTIGRQRIVLDDQRFVGDAKLRAGKKWAGSMPRRTAFVG